MKKLLLSTYFVFIMSFLGAQTIGIVGPAANGWPDGSNPTPDIMLTDNGDGTHSIDALALTTGPAKFRTNQNWNDPNYGGSDFPNGTAVLGGPDIPVTAGIYDIILDLNNNTYSFTDVSSFTEIELIGSAIIGNNPVMTTLDGENYELLVTQFANGDVLFREVGTSTTYGTNSFPSGNATNGGMDIPVVAGYYRIFFNFNTGAFSFEIPQVGIVGPAANGWPDGSNPTPDILMNTVDGDTYTLENQILNDGQLKFRQDLNWDVNWGGDTFPTGPFTSNDINAVAGTYNITFSRSAGTYNFEDLALSTLDSAVDVFKLYPNPTESNWFFENPNSEISFITLYDNLGRVVKEIMPNSNFVKVNGSYIPSGIYVAKVTMSNGNQKIIKLIKD